MGRKIISINITAKAIESLSATIKEFARPEWSEFGPVLRWVLSMGTREPDAADYTWSEPGFLIGVEKTDDIELWIQLPDGKFVGVASSSALPELEGKTIDCKSKMFVLI